MSIAFAIIFALLSGVIALVVSEMHDQARAHRDIAASAQQPHGIILGGPRKHAFNKRELVALPFGHALMLGDTLHSDEALLAAASAWNGALVFIDGRGLSHNLQRSGVIRFAPARPDSVSYNPLQAIGAGPRAWIEALEFARGLLGPEAEARAPSFTALMLDHLMTAPLEKRALPALRARLANPKRLLSELASLWTHDFAGDQAPHAEIARIVAHLAANPMKAAADFEQANRALRFLADGRFAVSCVGHDFGLSDLIAGDGPASLVIEMPPDALEYAAPLVAALLAQLVAVCAATPDADPSGRAKTRPLLLVMEAEAHAALETFMAGAPLLPVHASGFGLNALTQSRTPPRALAVRDFDAIAALGPQLPANAEALNAFLGTRPIWRPGDPLAEGATWATWIKGAMIDAPILKSRQLESLAAHEAYILTDDAQRRVRSVTLTTNVEARCSIQPREALTPPVLNWVASPLERPVQAPAQLKSLPATQAKSFVSKSAQIRKALRTKPSRAIDALPAPETKLL